MDSLSKRINRCLTELKSEQNAENMLREFKVSELSEVLAYLIEKYDERYSLLSYFWQSKSDACPIDETRMEDQLMKFEQFITLRDSRQTTW